jgi:hypothetical protein
MQNRVRTLFAGSALLFIQWVDRMAAEHGVPLLEEDIDDLDHIDLAHLGADATHAGNGTPLSEDHREPPSLAPYDALLGKPGQGNLKSAEAESGS